MKRLLLLPLFILIFSGCYSSIKIELRESPDPGVEITKFDSLRVIAELETDGGFFHNSFVYHGGWLFAAEGSGKIHAFDLEKQDHAGYASVRNTTVSAPPVFTGEKMYYLYRKKLNPELRLAKYNIRMGKEEFNTELNITGDASIFESGGTLVVVSAGSIHFFDTTGAEKRSLQLGSTISSKLMQSGDMIIAGLSDGRILELNTISGTVNHFATGKNEPVTSFHPVGDNYIACHYGGGIELTGRGGYQFWKIESGRVIAEPVISGSFVFVGDLRGMLYKINLKTGDLKEKLETGGLITEKVTVVAQKIVLPLAGGELILIDQDHFKVAQRLKTNGRVKTPVIQLNNRSIAGCDNGRILLMEF